MRERIKSLVKIIADTLPVEEPIYEFGSLQVPTQVGYADLRPYFPDMAYVGCDFREGPGVDKIIDLHDVKLPDNSVGTALLMDTVEHVERFWVAMAEIHRVLKPGGLFAMSSHMDFPIHDHPHDYWRFTPDAFRSMMKQFAAVHVETAGREDLPHTVVGVGFKAPHSKEFPPNFLEAVAKWKAERFDVEGVLEKRMAKMELEHMRYRRLRKNWFFKGFVKVGDFILGGDDKLKLK